MLRKRLDLVLSLSKLWLMKDLAFNNSREQWKQNCVTLMTPQHLLTLCFSTIIQQRSCQSNTFLSESGTWLHLTHWNSISRTVTNKPVAEHTGSGCSKFYKIRPQVLWGESSNKRLIIGQQSVRGLTTLMIQLSLSVSLFYGNLGVDFKVLLFSLELVSISCFIKVRNVFHWSVLALLCFVIKMYCRNDVFFFF